MSKNFKCNDCGAGFFKKGNMNRHIESEQKGSSNEYLYQFTRPCCTGINNVCSNK